MKDGMGWEGRIRREREGEESREKEGGRDGALKCLKHEMKGRYRKEGKKKERRKEEKRGRRERMGI